MSFPRPQPRGILRQSQGQADHGRVSHMGDAFSQRPESRDRDPSPQSASTPSPALTNRASRGPSLRVLSGGVACVKYWTEYLQNIQSTSGALPPVMFRVYGTLVSISPGARSTKKVSSKTLVITDLRDGTQSLRCVFHEIDRSLGPMKTGDHVAIAGRVLNGVDYAMQVFTVETVSLQEVEPFLARMENFAIRALKNII